MILLQPRLNALGEQFLGACVVILCEWHSLTFMVEARWFQDRKANKKNERMAESAIFRTGTRTGILTPIFSYPYRHTFYLSSCSEPILLLVFLLQNRYVPPEKFFRCCMWPGDSTVVFERNSWDGNQESYRASSLAQGRALLLRQGSRRSGMVRMEYNRGGTVAMDRHTKLNVL